MNKLYFTRVVEKARGLFTSSQRERDRQTDRQADRQAERERQTDRDRQRDSCGDGCLFLPVQYILLAFIACEKKHKCNYILSPSAAAVTGFDGVLTQHR